MCFLPIDPPKSYSLGILKVVVCFEGQTYFTSVKQHAALTHMQLIILSDEFTMEPERHQMVLNVNLKDKFTKNHIYFFFFFFFFSLSKSLLKFTNTTDTSVYCRMQGKALFYCSKLVVHLYLNPLLWIGYDYKSWYILLLYLFGLEH